MTMRNVNLYLYRVCVVRTPKHTYAIDEEVEAEGENEARELVLWAYPKGRITSVENIDPDNYY